MDLNSILTILSFNLFVFSTLIWKGHRCGISRIGWALQLRYWNVVTHTKASSTPSLRLHFPSRTIPRWATLTLHELEYKTSESHATVEEAIVTLWLFPFLLRPNSSLATVVLKDFIIRVFRSTHTPPWVQALRKNLIANITNGEWQRLDWAKKETQGLCRRASEKDDVQITLQTRNWEILNHQQRMYIFGSLQAQWRTDSMSQPTNSSLVLIGKVLQVVYRFKSHEANLFRTVHGVLCLNHTRCLRSAGALTVSRPIVECPQRLQQETLRAPFSSFQPTHSHRY